MSRALKEFQDEREIWDARQVHVLNMLVDIGPEITYGLLDVLSKQTDCPDNAESSSEAVMQRCASALRSLPDGSLGMVLVIAQASLGQLLNMIQIEAHERLSRKN